MVFIWFLFSYFHIKPSNAKWIPIFCSFSIFILERSNTNCYSIFLLKIIYFSAFKHILLPNYLYYGICAQKHFGKHQFLCHASIGMDSHHLLPIFEAGRTNVHRYKQVAIDRVFFVFWQCLSKDLKEGGVS